jgi:hypothetical protein
MIPMQMMIRRSSKKSRFPIQILRRLLPGSMPRRLHKTHHLKTIKLALILILKAKQNAILLVTFIIKKDIYLKIRGA